MLHVLGCSGQAQGALDVLGLSSMLLASRAVRMLAELAGRAGLSLCGPGLAQSGPRSWRVLQGSWGVLDPLWFRRDTRCACQRNAACACTHGWSGFTRVIKVGQSRQAGRCSICCRAKLQPHCVLHPVTHSAQAAETLDQIVHAELPNKASSCRPLYMVFVTGTHGYSHSSPALSHTGFPTQFANKTPGAGSMAACQLLANLHPMPAGHSPALECGGVQLGAVGSCWQLCPPSGLPAPDCARADRVHGAGLAPSLPCQPFQP